MDKFKMPDIHADEPPTLYEYGGSCGGQSESEAGLEEAMQRDKEVFGEGFTYRREHRDHPMFDDMY